MASRRRKPLSSDKLAALRSKLLSTFIYDEGVLTYKISVGAAKAGQVAGTPDPRGYVRVGVGGVLYYRHQLVWLMFKGELVDMLDHGDRNKGNDRLENLEPTNHSDNGHNKALTSNCTSGVQGVYLHKKTGRWIARIKVRGEVKYLGSGDFDQAVSLRREAEALYLSKTTGDVSDNPRA